MQISYDIYYKIAITHPYYNGGQKIPVALVPDADTKGFMARYKMRTVQRDEALEIYISSQDGNPPFIEDRDEESFSLNFYLQIRDRIFFSATDLPLIHFDQSTMHFSPDNSGEININFATEHEADQSPADYIGLLALDFPVVLSNGIDCRINFSSRQTRWRYHLVPHSATEIENITILSESLEPVEFESATGQLGAPLDKAITISLKNDRPYQARYDDSLSLKCELESDGQQRPIELRLPMASPDQLRHEQQDPGEKPLFFSDLYVYL